MYALFQDIWTEAQAKLESEASRTQAHYNQILSSERARASEQLQNAIARLQDAEERVHMAEARMTAANGQLQQYMGLYHASLARNDKLGKDIQKIKEENVDVIRRTRREKVEVEKRYRAAAKAVDGGREDMDRMKDECGVARALNVRLYAENRRLTRELEEVRAGLLKVRVFVSFCRSERADVL
jgi:chromosome segregation ATPase